MKSLLLLLAATAGLVQGEPFICDIPTLGCTNGMFNQALCECECISPFCPGINGDCVNPSNSCGGNKWTQCTRGVNCPWWQNALKAESCTTGPDVPLGLWEIYSTEKACCNTNFAYSEFCGVRADSEGMPTKYPTILAPEDDDFEVVPIKFDVAGLPDSISMRDLKDEMKTVLKRILLRLADRIPGLRITEIEEKVVLNRNLLKTLRSLKKDVTLYFNVHVVRDDDKKFGPLIIAELRDSYSEVLDQIQTFSDTKYFGGDLNLNFCTSQSGKFELCAQEIFDNPPPPPPRPAPVPTPVYTVRQEPGDGSGGDGDDGFPGWAIALIVIFALLILCCIAYIIFVSCCKNNRDDTKEINNNIYLEDEKSRASGYTSRRSPRSTRSGKTRSRQIVLAEPQDSKSDDGSFTINTHASKKTYASKQRQGRDPTMYASKLSGGRDPTMYIPGQEDRPDPDSDTLMLQDGESSRRYYAEDPPLRPKRDPTMYVDGNYTLEDPPLKAKRDPTMYVEGQQDPSVYVDEASVKEIYNDDAQSSGRFGMEGIDEEYDQYDQFGFRHASAYTESDVEYAHERRDPSHYDAGAGPSEEGSIRTQDPSVSSRSVRSKKSKKSKKPVKAKNDNGLRKSLQSDWEGNEDLIASLPDVTHVPNAKKSKNRQTQSFYK
mmetsp:Transcript_3682/g.6662  ORF Transcript_3682/g.6662 Transcript_3682/m.6662 type:complete len:659 (-) Transcript_3682:38-2014(-)